MGKTRQKLGEYEAKRDFSVSPEPRAKVGRSSRKLAYCVQKHLARSLHYDLRLEHRGVLLSWAVPKGPSLNNKDKRFAARTEDHPLEYGKFEGVIPEGYGAGIVMLWDRGTWEPESPDIDKALEEGEVKFRLHGVKLKGSWVLVRTRQVERGPGQWLLIKHRDEWSGDVDVVNFAPLSVRSFGDFEDILREKRVPAGWRKRLPVQSGESAQILRDAIARADQAPAKSAKADKPVRVSAAALSFGNKRPKLTNLDKPLYPTGFTKGQLIDYYTRMASTILPHLMGRAVTLKRFPEGVHGEAFFQKRCPQHRPPWVKTVRITRDETIDYCKIDDLSTLVWVANLAAIELHVPLAMGKAPDTPTAMIFDLDPGEPAGLRECFVVAARLTGLLDQLKLKSYSKLSGKKGLHVLVPLNTPEVTFEESRTFARAVAQALSRDDPKRITAIMKKTERPGRVFVDWNQNDRSKTTVCVYSLRADDEPRISWPADLNSFPNSMPRADTIKVPSMDPMAGLLSIRQKLPMQPSQGEVP